jgi:hypothetical protein
MKPDYTVRDLFSYGGFICGAATFMVSTTGWQVAHMMRLLCAVVVGLVVGFVATMTYDRLKSPRASNDRPRFANKEESNIPEEGKDEFGPRW